jgi:hypothetical protein
MRAKGIKKLLKRNPVVYKLLASSKALMFERCVRNQEAHYLRVARIQGLRYDEETVREMVQRRLRARGITPNISRDKHVFVAIRVRNWERVLIEELRRCGRVTHFDWAAQGFDDDLPGWFGSTRERMNEKLLHAVQEAHERQRIDLFLGYLSSHTVAAGIIDRIAKLGIVTVNLSLDDLQGFWGKKIRGVWNGIAPLVRSFDLNWTSTLSTTLWYLAEGGLPLFMPEAASPDVHRPYPVRRDIEVSFVGQCYGYRPILVEKLRKRGIGVKTFGPSWGSGPVSLEGMVKVYSRSMISLGFSGVGHSQKVCCLKGRDFEVPMSGGLYLTQYHPELETCFEVGREILCYRDVNDLVCQIQQGLRNPELLEQIRGAGRQRALKEHTWEHRMIKLLSVLGFRSRFEEDRYGCRKNSISPVIGK